LTNKFESPPVYGLIYGAIAGIVGSVLARLLYFLGISYLGPGKSLSITASSPLYAAFLAWIVLNEDVTLAVIIGTIVVVVGIIVLSRDIRTETADSEYTVGVALYPLCGAVLTAIAVIIRKLALNTGVDPIEAAAANMLGGLIVVLPVTLICWRQDIANLGYRSFSNFVISSLVMSFGYIFYFVGLSNANASLFVPLVQTQPLFAVVFSSIFLPKLETITRWSYIGSVVIVCGVVLIVLG